ncbi:MAG: hypothetical protein SF339_26120 [Blastocatellia bacterium]|nr:hypothetical protein [Blastocatellia bacterium]
MPQRITRRIQAVLLGVALSLLGSLSVAAGQIDEAARLDELRRLRDHLQVTASLRDSDAVVVVNERLIAEAARQFIGLEVALANGSTVRVTSVEAELKTAAALVKIGLQAKSSVTVNLQLLGRINGGEIENGVLRLPYRIMEVRLANGLFSSLLIKSRLGEWLKPETWNDELPALELPLEISDVLRIPAGRYDVQGDLPMEITSSALQAEAKLTITSLLVLEKRAVLALQLAGAEPRAIPVSFGGANDRDPRALETEIESLAARLNVDADLRLRLGRRFLSSVLAQFAGAQTRDFDIKLKPGRVRTEEVSAFVKITNYTDIESGEGLADIRELGLDQIAEGRIQLRLQGLGELDTRLRGKEYGIPYSFSPRVNFAIRDQSLPLQFVTENGRLLLRPLSGTTLPMQLRFSTNVAGQEIGINRTIVLQADRMFNRIELPAFFGRELPLPRRIEIDANGGYQVTKHQKLNYLLGNLRINANEDVLDVLADVKLSTP